MKKKLIAIALVLILAVTVSLVYAQENGYFLNVTNSNANLNTTIANSTVVENVTLTNGTLNLRINADNISTVTINGVNYTAQQTSNASSPSAAPQVTITYYGMNVGASAVIAFAGMLLGEPNLNQTGQVICYAWNVTMLNMNVDQPPGGSAIDQALAPLAAKYPQLLTENIVNPLGQGNSSQPSQLTLVHCCGPFGGNDDKCCLGLYANSPLSSDQINQLTQDLRTQLTSVIINWYS